MPSFVNLILSNVTVCSFFVAVFVSVVGSVAPSGLFASAASVNSKLSLSVHSRPVNTFFALSSASPSATLYVLTKVILLPSL